MRSEWWRKRSDRERYFIVIGMVIVALLLVYELVWIPLYNTTVRLQQRVQSQQQLLIWMLKAEQRIKRYRLAGYTEVQPTQQALLVVAEQTLANQKLANYLLGVQQPQSNQLTLTFNPMPFDEFITWLQQLWKQYGINVAQIQVSKTAEIGVVQVKVTLTQQHSS